MSGFDPDLTIDCALVVVVTMTVVMALGCAADSSADGGGQYWVSYDRGKYI